MDSFPLLTRGPQWPREKFGKIKNIHKKKKNEKSFRYSQFSRKDTIIIIRLDSRTSCVSPSATAPGGSDNL